MAVETTLDAVDRIQLTDDERLDIPDVLALQELTAEYVVRMLGGVMGAARGNGSSSDVTVSGSLNTLLFNTFTLASTEILNKAMFVNYRLNAVGDDEGQVVWFDPSDPGQQTTIDLDVVGQTPYIWAKRFSISDDADTRRKWDTGSGTEVVFSMATRLRHRVEFAVNASDHRVTTGDDQWFIVAQVESWSGSVPTIRTWHPFDLGVGPVTDSTTSWAEARRLGAVNALDGASLGVNHALSVLLEQLGKHRKADGTVHPLTSDPAVGLDDLKTLSDAAFDSIDNIGISTGYWIRLQSSGAGTWTEIAKSGGVSVSVLSLNSGWDIQLSSSHISAPKSVQISPGMQSASPVTGTDVVAQTIDISGGTVTIQVSTLTYLSQNSWSWAADPSGSPAVNTILDIMVMD